MAERPKHIISSFDAALDVLKNDVLMMSILTDQNFQTAIEALLNRDSEPCNQGIADDEEVYILDKKFYQDGLNILLRFNPPPLISTIYSPPSTSTPLYLPFPTIT